MTKREKDVARLLSQGLPNKQVGGNLGITERTVKEHRASIYKKWGIKSIAELVHVMESSDTAVPNMTWETDANGICTFISDELLAFFGKPKNFSVRDGCLDTYHPAYRQTVADQWHKAIQAKTTYAYPGLVRRADGLYVWTFWIAIACFNDRDEYIGHRGLMIEINPYLTRWLRLIPEYHLAQRESKKAI